MTLELRRGRSPSCKCVAKQPCQTQDCPDCTAGSLACSKNTREQLTPRPYLPEQSRQLKRRRDCGWASDRPQQSSRRHWRPQQMASTAAATPVAAAQALLPQAAAPLHTARWRRQTLPMARLRQPAAVQSVQQMRRRRHSGTARRQTVQGLAAQPATRLRTAPLALQSCAMRWRPGHPGVRPVSVSGLFGRLAGSCHAVSMSPQKPERQAGIRRATKG